MGIDEFIAYQHHHAADTADDPAMLDALHDHPQLMALLHDATRHGDLTALRAAIVALDATGGDDVHPTVLVAELLVRLIVTGPAPGGDRDGQLAVITTLHEQGLCHRDHFEAVLILAALDHGAATGQLPADIYDAAEKYISVHDDLDLADYLADIERAPSNP